MTKSATAWLLIALLASASVGGVTVGFLWDNSIKPKPTLPEYGQSASYAVEGVHRLLSAAKKADYTVDPIYTIHIPNADVRRFKNRLLETGPKLGWHIQWRLRTRELALTLPERDMESMEEMTRTPQEWLLEAMNRPAVTEVVDEPLINVLIKIDGYHGRHPWPMIIIGLGFTGIAITLMAIAVMVIEDPLKPRTTPATTTKE